MNEEYILEGEVDSITELILIGIFSIIGFAVIGLMILSFTSRLNKYERYDKVSASALYEEAVENTYKFTPYQAYMMGYNVDPWGPKDLSLTWWESSQNAGHIELSVKNYKNDLVLRNNMVSGANKTNPSVRGVLDRICGNKDIGTFYRNSTLYLNWTDVHSDEYTEYTNDGVNVVERGKREFKWVIETEKRQ